MAPPSTPPPTQPVPPPKPPRGRAAVDRAKSTATEEQRRRNHPYNVPRPVARRLNLSNRPAPTAGSQDLFGHEVDRYTRLRTGAPQQPEDGNAAPLIYETNMIAGVPKDNQKIIARMCTVILFWKGCVEEPDVQEYVNGAMPPHSLNYKDIVKKCADRNANLQRESFCPTWLVDFVNEKIEERQNDATKPLKYGEMTGTEKTTFWLSHYKSMRMDYGAPLDKVLNLPKIVRDRTWGYLLQTYYVVSCKAIFDNRTRVPTADNSLSEGWVHNPESGKLSVNTMGVYASCRAVPGEYFPNRPNINEIPVTENLCKPGRRGLAADLGQRK